MKKLLLLFFHLLLISMPMVSIAQRNCFDRAPTKRPCYHTDPFKEIISEEDSILHRQIREHDLKTITTMMRVDTSTGNGELSFHWKKEFDRSGKLVLDSGRTKYTNYAYDNKGRITGITSVVNGEKESLSWKYDDKGYISSYTEILPESRTVVKYVPGKNIREEIRYNQKNAITRLRIDSLDNYRNSTSYIVKDGNGKVIERYSPVIAKIPEHIPEDSWEYRRELANKTDYRVSRNKDGSRTEDALQYDGSGNPEMQTIKKYDSLDRLISWEVYGFMEVHEDLPLGGGPNYIRNSKPEKKGYYRYHWTGMVEEMKVWNSKEEIIDELTSEISKEGYLISGRKKFGDKYIDYTYSYTFYP